MVSLHGLCYWFKPLYYNKKTDKRTAVCKLVRRVTPNNYYWLRRFQNIVSELQPLVSPKVSRMFGAGGYLSLNKLLKKRKTHRHVSMWQHTCISDKAWNWTFEQAMLFRKETGVQWPLAQTVLWVSEFGWVGSYDNNWTSPGHGAIWSS